MPAVRTSSGTPPVTLTWDYDAQKKTLTLHLENNSGKDITAYNISMLEKYADGSIWKPYKSGQPPPGRLSPQHLPNFRAFG